MSELDKFEKLTFRQAWDFILKYKWVFVFIFGISSFVGKWVNERFLYMYESEKIIKENAMNLEKIVTKQNSVISTAMAVQESQTIENKNQLNDLARRFNYHLENHK